jgi:hypothetical protein
MRAGAVYHITAINGWREILNEQLGLLSVAGFPFPIHANFTGQAEEWGYVHHVAQAKGVDLQPPQFSDASAYEQPAHRLVEQVARESQADFVLYFHMKAVSWPNSWPRLMWRLYMNAWLLRHWRKLVDELGASDRDCAGTGWLEDNWPTGMFPGTFWLAKGSYLRTLTAVDTYWPSFAQCLRDNPSRGMEPRHAAEYWINSGRACRPLNYGPSPSCFWSHSFWTSNPQLCEFAYQFGMP